MAAAATDLALRGRKIAIVTGFYIPAGTPPAAETDGPPGAILLAQVLLNVGIDNLVVTDGFCFDALAAAARKAGYSVERLVRYPHPANTPSVRAGDSGPADTAARWRADFFQHGAGKDLSHLLALERVGPSHTAASLARQARSGNPPLARFDEKVPPAARDHCHNMRGENLDDYAGDLHRLFEDASGFLPDVKSIGIGDGANEIGMGVVAWEELERRLTGEQSGRVPCRVPCDWNIIAGTSNWGAYALAAATALLRGTISAVAPFNCGQQRDVLEYLVEHGPAVDGVTRRREPTVDGLPFPQYIQPWGAIRAKLGLEE